MTRAGTIIYAGGGTGGHLFPGLAVAECIKAARPDLRQVFIVGWRRTELDILGRFGFEHFAMDAPALPRRPWNFPRFLTRFLRAYRRCKGYLSENDVAVVVGLGGYGSVPMVLAARKRLPVVLLEQNTVPGRATRFLSRWASEVVTAWDQTARFLNHNGKVCMLGNPVRKELGGVDRIQARLKLGLQPEAPTLLVWGGSLGAHAINQVVIAEPERLKSLKGRLQVVHQTGQEDQKTVRGAYADAGLPAHVDSFIDAPTAYAASDLFVGRAGATTLAELCVVGLPAVLVPYPQAADDHQMKNARTLESAGGAVVIPQNVLTPDLLWKTVLELLSDQTRRRICAEAVRRLARPGAASDVASLILGHVR